MKIAIDIHGVLDQWPDVFEQIIDTVEFWNENDPGSNGSDHHEIHILTGPPMWLAEDHLKAIDEKYLKYKIFSIQDYLEDNGFEPIAKTDRGHPIFDKDYWNRAKGDYCELNDIDIVFDDSPQYRAYMPDGTLFCLVANEPTLRSTHVKWEVVEKEFKHTFVSGPDNVDVDPLQIFNWIKNRIS